MLFDANCQTDRELMENYFKKEPRDEECMTMREISKKSLRGIMIQTDPAIANEKGDAEPIAVELPEDMHYSEMKLAHLCRELLPENPGSDLARAESNVDDPEKDWANSPLWQHVATEFSKVLAKKGTIKLDHRPETPEQFKGLKPKDRLRMNLK